MSMTAEKALKKCLSLPNVQTVLDIGSGDGRHADVFRLNGKEVFTCDLRPDADYSGFFDDLSLDVKADLVWCSHFLEHQLNVGHTLEKLRCHVNEGGWICITVPPLKHNIVGGHVSLWNAGLLLYNMILAGFDCKNAIVKKYGYNISVIVQVVHIQDYPELAFDTGDIEKLSDFFPVPVRQGFDGDMESVGW